MLGGGIDLSVGSIFALATFAAVSAFFIFGGRSGWPCWRRSPPAGLFGAINGYLVGYLRLRAFLTTLVTFIIGRALFDILVVNYAARIQLSTRTSDLWDFIGDGTVHGLSVSVLAAIVMAIIAHVALTRSRPGWHMLAVGGSRRSAHNSGIRVRRDRVHDLCHLRPAAAGSPDFLIACRLSGAGPGTGLNLEILALTAAVVGGNSLGGGRGSVAKGIMGAIIVLVMTNGLIRLGYGTGTNQMVLGLMLAAAVTLDIRWLKNRHKVLNEVYVAPVYHRMGEAQSAAARIRHAPTRSTTAWPTPSRSASASSKGPRTSSSTATITSIAAPAMARSSASSRPTTDARRSSPIPAASRSGLPSTATAISSACVGAMGLYSIAPDGERDAALGRDAALLDIDRRRCPAARSQRLRRRAGRPHLLHRFDHALRRP